MTYSIRNLTDLDGKKILKQGLTRHFPSITLNYKCYILLLSVDKAHSKEVRVMGHESWLVLSPLNYLFVYLLFIFWV